MNSNDEYVKKYHEDIQTQLQDLQELIEFCSSAAKQAGLTKEDSEQILYKVRHPEWHQVRADILMLAMRINELRDWIEDDGWAYLLDEYNWEGNWDI